MKYYYYLILAYFIGGVPFGFIVGFITGHGDIRKKGSGNIGATNVWRVAGPFAALFVFIGDIGKGVLAVMVCRAVYSSQWPLSFESVALLGGFIAVLGHIFTPYLKFKGGKGVNTALGVFACLVPVESAIAVIIFLITVSVFRYISLGSIIATLSLAGILWVEKLTLYRPIAEEYLIASTLAALLILLAHHQNIRRILAGNEHRFKLRKATD